MNPKKPKIGNLPAPQAAPVKYPTAEQTPDLPPASQHHSTANKDIPIELLLELKRKNLNNSEIAKVVGCHHSNVSRRLAPYKDKLARIDNYDKYKADIFTLMQMDATDSIKPEDWKKVPVPSRILGICQLEDKIRLRKGQSTANIEILVNGSPAIVEAVKAAADDYLKRLMDGNGDGENED